MPRLTQKTLDKMFPCEYCGKKLRTRQGLAGHVQWVHSIRTPGMEPMGTEDEEKPDKLVEAVILRRINSESQVLTQAEYMDMVEMRADWHFIKHHMQKWNIKLNKADYKNYLLVAMAVMYGNQRLINKLNKELS